MAAYVDYDFYSTVFEGKMPYKQFLIYEFKARKFIDKITFNRINENNINYDIKMAVCIAIEKIKKSDSERGFKLSETVGKHSVSYSESLLRRFESSLYKEISIYIPSDLLYRGCDY